MKILSINCSHHASICFVDKGEITFYLESQRVDRKKYSNNIESAFKYLKDKEFDWCLYSGYENDKVSVNEYSRQINNIKNKYNLTWKHESFVNHHHLNHAACAFYNSGFKEAYCIVADGGGIPHYVKNKILGREILSIYKLSHPDKYELIHQVCANTHGKSFVENSQVSENTLSLGQLFDLVKNTVKSKEPGGVMALSAYGKRNKFINRILKINKNSFTTNTSTIYRMLSYTKKNNINFTKENISYRVQKDCESIIKFYIKKILKEEPNADICLSGGFFQNCVANYEFLKTSSNIYVDPWSHDGGTSIGAALMWYYICTKDKNIKKLKNIYLGPEHEIKEFKKTFVKFTDEDSWTTESVLTSKITNFKEVAELLANKNMVAIFQGRSEAGPRALGNRSLLYDARDPKAKEIVNLIKKREWYRPYAGTILLEHANDWFDLRGKKETQFMSYALRAKKEKINIIPGVLHIDNTSRMQTLKYEDNPNYYSLLKEFYNLTKVPLLLNTSLNVAGEPLVETLQEAVSFINNTNVNYLYLPDKNYLLIKNGKQ